MSSGTMAVAESSNELETRTELIFYRIAFNSRCLDNGHYFRGCVPRTNARPRVVWKMLPLGF